MVAGGLESREGRAKLTLYMVKMAKIKYRDRENVHYELSGSSTLTSPTPQLKGEACKPILVLLTVGQILSPSWTHDWTRCVGLVSRVAAVKAHGLSRAGKHVVRTGKWW